MKTKQTNKNISKKKMKVYVVNPKFKGHQLNYSNYRIIANSKSEAIKIVKNIRNVESINAIDEVCKVDNVKNYEFINL